MARHLRYQSTDWATHHVVSRCIQGFGFLKPCKQIVNVCTGVLGYSLNQYQDSIKLHHYVFLSNHFHLLVSSKDTRSLDSFMCHFKSNLARELARIHDWHGSLWQSRYSSEEILDEDGLIEIFKYITENSVKEGLVNHPNQWPGLHGYHQLVECRSVKGDWIDRTGLYLASQRNKDVNPLEFITVYEISLDPPPLWDSLSKNEYQVLCAKLCKEAIQNARKKHSKGFLGVTQILKQPVYQTRFTKRSTRPLCRTKCIKRLKAYQAEYYEFKVLFQEASAVLRKSLCLGISEIQVFFPLGGIPLFGGYIASS